MNKYYKYYYKVSDIAAITNKAQNTVRNWIKTGVLQSSQYHPNGWHSITREDLKLFINRHSYRYKIDKEKALALMDCGCEDDNCFCKSFE